MMSKDKRKAWMGVIGGAGVVVALAGFVGGFMSPTTTVVAAGAVWILGATLVNALAS